jgi:hypothetical protein
LPAAVERIRSSFAGVKSVTDAAELLAATLAADPVGVSGA